MRRWFVLSVAALIVACGDSTEPAVGTVRLSIAARCAFSPTSLWDLYVDLAPVGTDQIAPGNSATFSVAPGSHSIRVIGHSGVLEHEYDWTGVIVQSGAETTLLIDCPPL